ncbi:MAG: hypothetical protein V3U72_04990 [Candidatus Aenigmarchaeota archaeon]
MNLKCLFGFHRLEKLGGPRSRGGGKFEQAFICSKCRKVKSIIGIIVGAIFVILNIYFTAMGMLIG